MFSEAQLKAVFNFIKKEVEKRGGKPINILTYTEYYRSEDGELQTYKDNEALVAKIVPCPDGDILDYEILSCVVELVNRHLLIAKIFRRGKEIDDQHPHYDPSYTLRDVMIVNRK